MMDNEIIKKYTMDGQELRLFSNDKLQDQIDRAFNSLPEGTKGAVIAHADLSGGFALSVVAKPLDHLTIVAAGFRSWSGELSGEAEVRYTW